MLEGEDKLIRGAKRGEAGCFNELYSHYLAPIYRFIYMKVTNREEAEDLTHEVFLSAWQNMARYRSRGFPFSSWLYQIARNRVIDFYRLKKKFVDLEEADTDADPIEIKDVLESAIDNDLSLDEVRLAIQNLHPDQQDVILMRFMEDMPYETIASTMDKSEGAVRLIQHRALKSLREILKTKKQEIS